MQLPTPQETLSERVAFLSGAPLFAGLNQEALAALAGDFRRWKCRRGEIIFRQDDPSREFYVVREGKVRIFKTSLTGGETSINIFSRGDIIGEFATLDDQPRSATAKALADSILLKMSQTRFLQHLHEMPALAMALTRLLAGKVRWTAAYAETIAQYDTPSRLLHLLLLYNDQYGRELEAGKQYELDLALRQADLGSLVGARREWINRLLGQWRNQHLLRYEAGKLTILDLPAMQAELENLVEAQRGSQAW